MQCALTQHNCFFHLWLWKPICSSLIILENSNDGEYKIFFFLFYQFPGGMKYENQDSCPGHINVSAADDRPHNDYSWWWVPSPPSDHLIHCFNHISLLPKMMTKLIILTSENFHNLALAYLILFDFWCFPNMYFLLHQWSYQLSFRPTIYVCCVFLSSSGNSLNLVCSAVK